MVGNANCRANSARIGVAIVFLTLLLRLMAGRILLRRIVHDILLESVLFAEGMLCAEPVHLEILSGVPLF